MTLPARATAGAPAELDDLTLARARRGDARACRDLVVRYQRPVFAVLSRMRVGPPERVEDLAQETFLRVFRALPGFRADGPARLSASLENAEAQVRSLMLAGRDARDPLVEENRRLRDQLDHARETLRAERAELAAREGKPLPFPPDLPAQYRQDGLQRAFMEALAAAGVQGDVRSIDCTEFPCVVYGEAHHAADRAASEADMKRLEAELRRAYPDRTHAMHEGVWARSHRTDDGKEEHVSNFAISVYPNDVVDEATRAEIRRRMRHRNEAYMESLEP